MSTNTNAATYEVLYARKVSWQLVISDVSIFLNLGQIIYLFVTTQDKVAFADIVSIELA